MKLRVQVIEQTPEKTEITTDFWAGKVPCWEMSHCPQMIKGECPAPKFKLYPCWEIEGTYCKLDDYGATGRDTSICEACRVYRKWGEGKPINIRLTGQGIDTALRDIEGLIKAGAQ